MARSDGGRKVRSRLPVRARFFTKVIIREDGCWGWSGHINKDGYGHFSIDGYPYRAARKAYEFWRGPIGDSLVIDHLCRNRECVNPKHLEVVSVQTNTLRGNTLGAMNAAKMQCIRGHEFAGRQSGGRHRKCVTCERAAKQARNSARAS